MIITLNIITICCVIIFSIIESQRDNNLFNPVNISALFIILFCIADIIVDTQSEKYYNYCTPSKLQHCNVTNHLYTTIVMSISYILITFSIWIGKSQNSLDYLLHILYPVKFSQSKSFNLLFALILVGISILLLNKLLGAVGGLFFLWLNMELRSILLQGSGYVLTLFKFTSVVGFSLLAIVLYKRNLKLLSVVVVLTGCMLSGVLGSRGAIAHFFFVFLVACSFHISKIRLIHLIQLRFFLLAVVLISILIGGYALRTTKYFDNGLKWEALVSDSVRIIEEQVVGRFWRNERGMIAIDYFDNHSVFLGSTYLGVVFAPIPRSMWSDKPPVDSGKYALRMTNNEPLNPPVSSKKLGNEAMPPGIWEAYWNFGLTGVIVLSLISGYIFGAMYRYFIRVKSNVFATLIYGNFAYFGATVMSSNGIMEFVTASVFCLFVSTITFILRTIKV